MAHVKTATMFQKKQKGMNSRARVENLPVIRRKNTSNLERETKTYGVNIQSNLRCRGKGDSFIASYSLDWGKVIF